MRDVWFEVRYLIMAPFTLALLVQFAVLMWVQRRVPKPLLYLFYPAAAVFLVEDFIYQVVVGTFLFLDRPRDVLFTGRLKRLDAQDPADYQVWRFKRVLNALDPGHV
ncbi:MAG: hypothetical protein ACNA7F_02015 [Roseovarius sp.]